MKASENAAAKRPAAAAAYLGFSKTKLNELVRKDPTFPKPVRLGCRCTLYYTTELDKWLALQAAQQRAA